MKKSSQNSGKSPREILQTHFEEHQQQQDGSSVKGRKNQLSIPVRVRRIQEELATHSLTTALGSVSLNDKKQNNKKASAAAASKTAATSDTDIHQEMADTLLDMCHAAMGTDLNAESQASVDAILELATALSVHFRFHDSDDQPPMLANVIVPRALDFSRVLAERGRVQACHWLGCCVREMIALRHAKKGDQEDDSSFEWIEDCLEKIQTAMLIRVNDKSQLVRHAAIRASSSFFGCHNNNGGGSDDNNTKLVSDDDINEDILQALLFSCAHDSSFANRIQAIASLPCHETVVEHIIYRIRDVHAKVRVQALDSLQHMARHMTTLLSQSQCADIVQAGLTERCAPTKLAASKLICSGWMKAFKYNPLALLQHMGVAAYEETCEKTLLVIFEAADEATITPLLTGLSRAERQAFASGVFDAIISIQSENRNGDVEDESLVATLTLLDAEAVFLSRVSCQRAMDSKTMSSVRKSQVIAQVVPDITVLCQVLQSHLTWLMNEEEEIGDDLTVTEKKVTFVCCQFLRLAKMCDLHEEGSRRHFSIVMKQVLGCLDTPDDVVEGCLKAWSDASEHEDDFMQDVAGILDSLSHYHQDHETPDGDVHRVLRVLLVLSIVLETRSTTTSAFASIGFEKYIIPAVTHADTSVREAGVSCFGKLGLYTDQESRVAEFKPLLLRVASRPEEKLEVRGQALLALADWVLLLPDMLTPCDIDGKEISLMTLVTELMIQAPWGGIAVAAEVAVKLLFSGKFCDSELLAQLLILFFDEPPKTKSKRGVVEDDEMDSVNNDTVKQVGSPERLQQLLSIFFPAYAMKSPTGRDALLGCIGPLLTRIQQRQTNGSHAIKPAIVVTMINYVCSTVGRAMPEERGVATNNSSPSLSLGNNKDEPTDKAGETDPGAPKSGINMSASIQIAHFLANVGDDLGTMMLRSLCKLMSNMSMDVAESENPQALALLKNYTEELGMLITDSTSLRSLASLNETLAEITGGDDTETEGGERESEEETVSEEEDDDAENDKDEEVEEDQVSENKDDIPDDDETLVNGMKLVSVSLEKENTTEVRLADGKSARNAKTERGSRAPRQVRGNIPT